MDLHTFSRPHWLFFDLDDTLWDFNRNSEESLRHVFSFFREINGAFPSFSEFADTYHAHNSALWNDFSEGKVSSQFLKSERWRRTLFPGFDSECHNDTCLTIDREYLSFLASQPFLVEGVENMLRSLSKDYMIGVLSNGFVDTQYCKLSTSGLWRFITRTVVSDEAGFRKPDPRLYQFAVDATGASGIPVMIGDNPLTDIMGALRSGWEAIWYNPDNKAFPLSPDNLEAEGVDTSLYLGSATNANDIERLIRTKGNGKPQQS